MAMHFTPAALKFLRGLARNNDRGWFDPRKPVYERELKAPLLALIEEVNHALADFAPEHIRPPHKTMMRIYRDTRFALDKRPYKTQVAAWWAKVGLEKTSGAGFYFSLSAKEMVIAAGMYMPQPEQLLAVRQYLVDHHAELRGLLADRKLKAAMEEFEGNPLTRPPRGFTGATAAMDLVMCRQWGVAATLPAEKATQAGLRKEIVRRFALAAPVVEFLNRPITASGQGAPKPGKRSWRDDEAVD